MNLISNKFSHWFSDQECDAMQICLMLENIPGISFFFKDTNHRLLHMNQRFLPRIGMTKMDELFGKTDFDLFPPSVS